MKLDFTGIDLKKKFTKKPTLELLKKKKNSDF